MLNAIALFPVFPAKTLQSRRLHQFISVYLRASAVKNSPQFPAKKLNVPIAYPANA
jgi:hypothetical protein